MIIHIETRTLGLFLDSEDIINALDHKKAEALIKEIDLAMADYDFTQALAKYFIQTLYDECESGGEEFDLSELSHK